MAEVHHMFNAVTVDQELASDLWFALFDAANQTADNGWGDTGHPTNLSYDDFMELADRLALKMYDQDCGLSSQLEKAGLLEQWILPIAKHRLKEKEE